MIEYLRVVKWLEVVVLYSILLLIIRQKFAVCNVTHDHIFYQQL
jgi:hypothetical protein